MTESGTKSKRPRPNTTGDVRSARAVADGGNGSLSMPRACLSAGMACRWITGPPSWTSGSHAPPRNAVAWTSTSSPRPPAGFSWHSPQATELNRGPSPVAGVNTLSNTSLPRANRSSCCSVRSDRGSPGCTEQQLERFARGKLVRSEEHTSELQSQSNLVCRLLLEKKKKKRKKLQISVQSE